MKITANELKEIQNRKKTPSRFVNYELVKTEWGGFTIKRNIKLIPYLIAFIPAHLLQLVALLWDGGLKEFSIESRKMPSYELMPDRKGYEGPSHYKNACKVWERHSQKPYCE